MRLKAVACVTIGNSVTSIGDYAFDSCSSLTGVTIPNSVTSIGDGGFDFCFGLTSVTIPNSVTSIGIGAFANCTKLTTVTIGNSVTSIGGSVFQGCTSLTNVTIPNSVTSIEDYAFFYCSSLTSVMIPNSVSTIGAYTFEFYYSLTNATISRSVTSIGPGTFTNCTSLTAAYFLGNAPPDNGNAAFNNDPAIVYYLAGTAGWGSTFGTAPAVLWNPQAVAPGFTGGQFGFNLTGPAKTVIVVKACTNLSNPVWLPVATNTFSASGASTFNDPASAGQPSRYYRFRSP
jgi:BspA type Leucine rich repeat region (6 copies)